VPDYYEYTKLPIAIDTIEVCSPFTCAQCPATPCPYITVLPDNIPTLSQLTILSPTTIAYASIIDLDNC
jgi:hypothetical protein